MWPSVFQTCLHEQAIQTLRLAISMHMVWAGQEDSNDINLDLLFRKCTHFRSKSKHYFPDTGPIFQSLVGHCGFFEWDGVIEHSFKRSVGELLQNTISRLKDTVRGFCERTAVVIAIDLKILCE